MRPWNAPAPIDEMEFWRKSQEKGKHKKEKGNERECKNSSRRKERLEKTPSLRTLNPLYSNDMIRNVSVVICRYETI